MSALRLADGITGLFWLLGREMRLGNDTKRMRNCNGLVGLMSLVRVFWIWKGKGETSLGAYRTVVFLDQHHLRDDVTAWSVVWILRFFSGFRSF